MEDDILRAAKTEATRLEALLHEHPIYQRLQAVRRVIELYDERGASLATPPHMPLPATKQGSRAGSQASAIRNGAAQFLLQKGARASSGEIYQALLLQGVEVKGKKPTAVVASYLSHSNMFDAASEGYGLSEWNHPKVEPDAETPDSSELSGAPRPNGMLLLSQ